MKRQPHNYPAPVSCTLRTCLTLYFPAFPENLTVTVWPPGSSIYLGECVLLQCTVKSNSTFTWNYRWYRHRLHTALTPNPRHLVSGDSYSITAVTRDDAGTYWCEADQRERNTSRLSSQAVLAVSGEQQLELLQRGIRLLLYGLILCSIGLQ